MKSMYATKDIGIESEKIVITTATNEEAEVPYDDISAVFITKNEAHSSWTVLLFAQAIVTVVLLFYPLENCFYYSLIIFVLSINYYKREVKKYKLHLYVNKNTYYIKIYTHKRKKEAFAAKAIIDKELYLKKTRTIINSI